MEIGFQIRKVLASIIFSLVRNDAVAEGKWPTGGALGTATVYWPYAQSANNSPMLSGLVEVQDARGNLIDRRTLFYSPRRAWWVPVFGSLARMVVSRIGVRVFKPHAVPGTPVAGKYLRFPVTWVLGFGAAVCVVVKRPNNGRWDTPWGAR
jgi:hypothetical protein